MQQHIERLGDAWCRHWITLDDSLVGLRAADSIVGLDGQDFLKHVAGTEGLQCPDFHLTKALATELSLTTKRLLGNQTVRADRA